MGSYSNPITCNELRGHKWGIESVAFSPDSRFALTGSHDDTARLWNLTSSPITSQPLTGHLHSIKSVAFSPDGHLAATGSYDETARLWDLTKTPITSKLLNSHTNTVIAAIFSPDGRSVLTGSDDKTACLWKIESIDTAALALENVLFLVKLMENDDFLIDDSQALKRLQGIMKETQHPLITKLLTDYFYRANLPEKECWICSDKYDPESRICMQLACCKKTMCKVCLDRLGGMSYSTEFERYRFEHVVQNKCPFCNKPANQMGIIKKIRYQ